MSSQIRWAYGLPEQKLAVIPNGVDVDMFNQKFERQEFRGRFASPNEKIVLFVGRLVYEKGVQVLINSLPKILTSVNAKLVIVGDGYMMDSLKRQAESMGLTNKVFLTGFLDEQSLRSLYKCADVCVVPSLYEPFGITALEAMAARVPVVVSDAGGLSEIIEHDVTGIKVYPDNPESLAWGITSVLLNPSQATRIQSNAYRKVMNTYDWSKIREGVKTLYEGTIREYQAGSWKPT